MDIQLWLKFLATKQGHLQHRRRVLRLLHPNFLDLNVLIGQKREGEQMLEANRFGAVIIRMFFSRFILMC